MFTSAEFVRTYWTYCIKVAPTRLVPIIPEWLRAYRAIPNGGRSVLARLTGCITLPFAVSAGPWSLRNHPPFAKEWTQIGIECDKSPASGLAFRTFPPLANEAPSLLPPRLARDAR